LKTIWQAVIDSSAAMSSPNATLRQRAGKEKTKANGKIEKSQDDLKDVLVSVQKKASNDLDYKIAIGVITFLAFATRFTGISHPNEVVFDEVHFGKVCQREGKREQNTHADHV